MKNSKKSISDEEEENEENETLIKKSKEEEIIVIDSSSGEEDDEEDSDIDYYGICKSCYNKPVAKPINKKKGFLSLFWVTLWIGLNMSLFFTNKYLYGRDPPYEFPIFVIMTGTFSTFIGSCIAIFVFKLSEFPIQHLKQHKILLLFCSICQAVSYVMENISIEQMSVALNQVIKATGPAFIIILSFIIYRKTYPLTILFCTLVIIAGVIITIFTSPSLRLVGFLYAQGSLFFASLQCVLIAKLFQDPKLNALALVASTSLPSALACVPLFFIFEYQKMRDYSGPTTIPALSVVFLAISACFYNLAHFYIIKYTSALYYVIVGNLKVVLVIIISSFVFSNGFTPLNYLGATITMTGFILYNIFKYYEKIGERPPLISKVLKCCRVKKKKKKNNINSRGGTSSININDGDDNKIE